MFKLVVNSKSHFFDDYESKKGQDDILQYL